MSEISYACCDDPSCPYCKGSGVVSGPEVNAFMEQLEEYCKREESMYRYALVKGLRCDPDVIGRYLPSNYNVLWSGKYKEGVLEDDVVVIQGKDNHGFTLNGYVIPRLGSGMYSVQEVDLSHPVFKLIPSSSNRRD